MEISKISKLRKMLVNNSLLCNLWNRTRSNIGNKQIGDVWKAFDISDIRVKTVSTLLNNFINKNTLPSNVSFYHVGKCAHCGRKLTDPKSIVTGIGPTCSPEAREKRKNRALEKLSPIVLGMIPADEKASVAISLDPEVKAFYSGKKLKKTKFNPSIVKTVFTSPRFID